MHQLFRHPLTHESVPVKVREYGEHGDPVLQQGLQLREAGGGEGGDGVRQVLKQNQI